MKEGGLHETYINRCLDLASMGLGNTAPNPMVGSVIVHNNRIIGEGYHRSYGGPHAEVNAVNAVTDKRLLPAATLYVNLEPCSHTGKTPPCADMIVRSGIRDVVIGTIDPNPLVAGNGIRTMQQAGIRVMDNILPEKCQSVNRRFFTFHTHKRPYIILKWAKTKDGYIDINRGTLVTEPTWISNEISRMVVHKWRSEEQGILVGTNTALMDNPKLSVREWPGKSPLRMVIDRKLRLPANLNLLDNSLYTLVFNESRDENETRTQFVKLDFSRDILPQILAYLYHINIQSLFVEGGRKLIESFITENLWDEARVFTGAKTFGSGIHAPDIPSVKPLEYHIREDLLEIFFNE